MNYKQQKKKKAPLLLGLAASATQAIAHTNKAIIYRQRADSMYARVWTLYKTAAYPHLFSENYPSSKTDSLTYMQGDKVKEKEVSFLWPYSGIFSATNAMMRIPGEQKKYQPYLDSVAVGM